MRNAHFDLVQMEAQIRAMLASVGEQAQEAIKRGDADPMFISVQRHFDEARVQFGLAPMRAENEGADRMMVAEAAGIVLALMYSSLEGSFNEEERLMFSSRMKETYDDIVENRSIDGAPLETTSLNPIKPGHA